ncbi:type I-E CRISPR-associated protein Cas5/CasD [Acidomonas methanolica]|uniref:CRISPR-associated protein Cas5 n=1 Tax=Acidomonas methanolica NBRC 104435 TaxID=1231351 RepID=A0A023D3J1_ACIMT|nr:type I-E CRISPR-associated protein Cas5/CasD [Acidomonas methanolica]TCS21564.1 CRISPR-associated Cas5e family protein [Acidomonas methanolica]GAJ28391.1 CRISPR-associated protein Cas5 [Acidomonas methanolica NBRC 104435]GBQ45844.1 CRISPR-associated Cas5 family protein [Acidomonas methanolica]GEL00389.1 type I-E CRISPR-associated protein Cas5/CasD [Acidomonas methanolica NBRC 104435]
MSRARDYLLLRLEAPLMAFGGPKVDAIGPTRDFPGQSQLAGLLGSALGYDHAEAEALEVLQSRLRLASLLARSGEQLRDYQTVDLGLPHLSGTGWTTRGRLEARAGASSEGTHIRQRWYLADALVLVALTLDPPEPEPSLQPLAEALDHPARPLFIGRKPCLPAAPIRLGAILSADTPEDALREGLCRLSIEIAGKTAEIDARLLPDHPDSLEAERLVDRRDWRNQMHTGSRLVHRLSLHAAAGGAP